MSFRIIEKKIKSPALPYLYVKRDNFNQQFKSELDKNKKFLFIHGLSGYGKTIAIKDFFQENNLNSSLLWYSLDEWDKDPVTFLNYIFHVLKTKLKKNSESFETYFSQPFTSESILKNFIGQLSNELEASLENETYLIFDNFQEIQNEEIILKIFSFLFNYCPDKLKIIIISNTSLPEQFISYRLKQELYRFEQNSLFLDLIEAQSIFSKLEIDNPELLNELVISSNKSISLFILLAQNIIDYPAFISTYKENKLYKDAIRDIIMQIYQGFSNELKNFIMETIMLPKISLKIISQLTEDANVNDLIETLKRHGIIFSSSSKDELSYNQVFIPILEELFFLLSKDSKDNILTKILKLSDSQASENSIQFLLKTRYYQKVIEMLSKDYEYYFRNYLYETLTKLIIELNRHYNKDAFINYLEIRLKRSTGNINKAKEQISQIDITERTSLILLEEGICEAALGHFKEAIIKLNRLESEFDLKDKLTLINCIGISYMHNHQLNDALNYFNQAVSLKNDLIYTQDLIKVYHNLGLTYTWKGEFSGAIESYEQSLYMSKQFKVLPLAMTYNNLSIIYNLQGNFEKAYQGCIEGLEIVRKLKNPIDEIFLYLTITESYRGLKNYFKVDEYIHILEELLAKTPNVILDALLLKQKAYISVDKNEEKNARDFLLKAIHIRKLNEGDPLIIEYKLELAIIDYNSKNYISSLNLLSEIEDEIKKGEHKYHLARLYVYKALSYYELGENNSYFNYQELATQLIDKYNYTLLKEKINSDDKKVIPDFHGELKITTFGDLEISLDGVEISKKDWSGKKTKLLFLYLLLNKSGITKEQIIQALFPEGDVNRSALHVMISRLRKAIATIFKVNDVDLILFSDDLYKFNFSINYLWDSERFENLIKDTSKHPDEKKFLILEEAISLYQNHFMNGFEIESWVFNTQEYYRQIAYRVYGQIAEYYLSKNKYNELLKLSNHFFSIDNCFEKACEYKMKALISLDRKSEALKQYDVLANSLNKILNDQPSKELKIFRDQIALNKI